jgi:hypothetical protein
MWRLPRMARPDRWTLLGNIGDADPLAHGGHFVYEDSLHEYGPEAEYLQVIESPSSSVCDDLGEDGDSWMVYRYQLERFTYGLPVDDEPMGPLLCPLNEWHELGILSDNRFHPSYPVWFSRKDAHLGQERCALPDLARTYGITATELLQWFLSTDPLEQAQAYELVASYHGWDNLDSYPLEFNPEDRPTVEERYRLGGRDADES